MFHLESIQFKQTIGYPIESHTKLKVTMCAFKIFPNFEHEIHAGNVLRQQL